MTAYRILRGRIEALLALPLEALQRNPGQLQEALVAIGNSENKGRRTAS